MHRPTFDAYPHELQDAFREAATDAIAFQRGLAIEEDQQAKRAILDAGCEIITLSPEEHEAFVAAVKPIYGEARAQYGKEPLELAGIR